jgi:DNA polymerase-3 subunit delta'
MRWLEPENNYTVAHLEPIFKTISFALDPGQQFFFVLERADMLSTTCANSLLKSLEEPPPGYHFILLAQRRDTILPTISSRCVITVFQEQGIQAQPALYKYFATCTPLAKITEFGRELDRTKITEREALDLVDLLYSYWAAYFKKALAENAGQQIEQAGQVIQVLEQARHYSPMPGSSKIFLRNLFLQFSTIFTQL